MIDCEGIFLVYCLFIQNPGQSVTNFNFCDLLSAYIFSGILGLLEHLVAKDPESQEDQLYCRTSIEWAYQVSAVDEPDKGHG